MSTKLSLASEAPVPTMSKGRSRVTNGNSLFMDRTVDQRSPEARRFANLCELHSRDASPAGPEHLTTAQAQLIRRVDLEEFARVSSHLRRMLETLGMSRVAKDITPVLHAYVKAQNAKQLKKAGAI